MSCAGATAADGIADGIADCIAHADSGAGASAAQTPSDTALGVWDRARAGLPHRYCSYTRRGTKRESLMITIQ